MAFYRLIVDLDESCIELGQGNDWEGIVCSEHPEHQRAGRRISSLHVEVIGSPLVDFNRTIWVMSSSRKLHVLR